MQQSKDKGNVLPLYCEYYVLQIKQQRSGIILA